MNEQELKLQLYMASMLALAKLDLDQTVHTLHSVVRAPALPKVLSRGAIFGMDPSKEVGQ